MPLIAYVAVFVGGGAGSLLRWKISELNPSMGNFPWGTLLANLLASATLVVLAFYFTSKENSDAYLAPLMLTTGFCGGFSTFSTFSWESFCLIQMGKWPLALAYVSVSLIACIGSMFALMWALSKYAS